MGKSGFGKCCIGFNREQCFLPVLELIDFVSGCRMISWSPVKYA